MVDTTVSNRPSPFKLILFSLLGLLALVFGWAIFAQYRVHHVGLAL